LRKAAICAPDPIEFGSTSVNGSGIGFWLGTRNSICSLMSSSTRFKSMSRRSVSSWSRKAGTASFFRMV
jgi:hypothetical protein